MMHKWWIRRKCKSTLIIKAILLAAAVFLFVQLIFMILMYNGEPKPPLPKHKIRSKKTISHEGQDIKLTTKLFDHHQQQQQQQQQQKGLWKNATKDIDNDAFEFHPKNIHRPKQQVLDSDKLDLQGNIGMHQRIEDSHVVDTNVINFEKFETPRGVLASQANLYTPDINGMFTCLHSKEQITASHINDDYCDCPDHTDEPGTSACSPHARFFCGFQISEEENPVSVWSGRVNDGVCDCCDGSDEWASDHPDHLPAADDLGVHQAPCADHCQELRAELEHKKSVKAMGAKIKQQYIEAGQHVNDPLFGDDGAFFELSRNCFTFTFTKYVYEVCPFQKVTQSAGGAGDIVTIGKTPRWVSQDAGNYVLLMEGGSSRHCPGGPRSTKIRFECGLEDAVIRIEEAEVCSYMVQFDTPAAC